MSENYFHRDNCRLCFSKNLSLAFSLKKTPPANEFIPKNKLNEEQECFPLDVYFCNDCTHLQLLDVVNPSILFRNYVYVSGTSLVFINHFKNYASSIVQNLQLQPNAFVIDVGSNDGTLLKCFKEYNLKVLGVDPARDIAAQATANGIETIPEFFTNEIAERIKQKQGNADVVVANNVFAHIDDLTGTLAAIKNILKPNGYFVFEVSYLVDVFEKTLFDTIYHEHLAYHAVRPLQKFFAKNGMQLIATQSVDSHGGSLRGIAQYTTNPNVVQKSVSDFIKKEEALGLHKLETYRQFERKINDLKTQLTETLRDLKAKGKTIAAFGAPAKATTLMYHFELNRNVIDFIVDDSPLKQNLFSPGLHIPVLPSNAIYEKKPDYIVVLAWNFADSIIEKHKKFTDNGGHFIVPIPKLRII